MSRLELFRQVSRKLVEVTHLPTNNPAKIKVGDVGRIMMTTDGRQTRTADDGRLVAIQFDAADVWWARDHLRELGAQ